MAFKKGRVTTKSIGTRKQRKSQRLQSPRSDQGSTLMFEITDVREDNRQRLADTVVQRTYVVRTEFKPVGNTLLWLFVEINLTWVPKQKHDNVVRTLEQRIRRDIKHRIAHPERVTASD